MWEVMPGLLVGAMSGLLVGAAIAFETRKLSRELDSLRASNGYLSSLYDRRIEQLRKEHKDEIAHIHARCTCRNQGPYGR